MIFRRLDEVPIGDWTGGANRDRTDDLKLAKLALSQLSYGPKPDGAYHISGKLSTAGPTQGCGGPGKI